MVIIKTIDYKYRNILYVKMKNNNFINNQLTYLESKDHEMKMKFMAYLFSYLQKNIMPVISNIEEVSREETIDEYVSSVFKNKQEEVDFLNGLEENLL